jgi:recombinational DNA repair ATPase RecF
MTQTRARLDALRDEREALRRGVQNVADRYHADHPGALARLEVVERELRRAQAFRDSVTLAKQTIERVARETHRRWAEFLNQRVTDLLKDVGSSIGRVRFGEDLDFAVSLPGGQQAARGKAVHQLSSGARDQLHLAVRLAISEFLSRGGESLPLLIDDCFATSDDDRTRQGMKLLLDTFSRQHQILFVTCHRARHEAIAALDPTLYDERVHWLELRSAVVGGV